MTIHFQNYVVIRECKGNQANKIYIVEDKDSKQMMILKLIKIYDLEKQLREIEVHKRLNYKFVIKMIDYDISKTHIILLIEYAKYGDLFSILPKLREIPEKRLLKFYYQFLKAMDYLHTQGFVHRDIKPENILITKKFSPRLADFGTSAKTDFVKNTFCGTYEYMAPEIYQRHKQTEKVDIWALGILLYEMTHQFTPFKKKSVYEIKKILDENKIEFRKDLNPLIKNFILRILKFDPVERPTTQELLADPLFADFFKRKTAENPSSVSVSPRKQLVISEQEETKFVPVSSKIEMEDFKESDLIDRKVITPNVMTDSKFHTPHSKTPLKKIPSVKQYTGLTGFTLKPNTNLDHLKTKSQNELLKTSNKSSQKNLNVKSFREPQQNIAPKDEKSAKNSYKDLVANKAVVSSLYRIKSMFDEYRESDISNNLITKAQAINDSKSKSGSGVKLGVNSKYNSLSYNSNTGSTKNLFKNIFSKLVKAPTSALDKDETSALLKKPKIASVAKKPFVSMASLESTSRHLNNNYIKKQLAGLSKNKPIPSKPELPNLKNIVFSIEEIH
jgi:serine/threonine protein kinase